MRENSHILFHSIHQLSRQLTRYLNEALEPFGLYNAQWSVLFVLKEKGTLTQKELCEYLAVEAPPMTRTIQRLVKQGYVEQQAGVDKRKKHIQLTAKAVGEFPAWEAAVLEANEKVLKLLPENSQEALQQIISEWTLGLKGGAVDKRD
ncbi:MarR family winged helix-turn-helix transcriptional regulator [Mesobacillus foraminis]|jgi:DNA-binding MarR family transcriptional regulator|uniref:DNA-binding MarR family transcriptional regulator n=1 Tax=Mesobacillus foraminis TaxID=279826 RepID=A0A4R2AXX8_9BACI|nr:MarR family transcriptional regulator [Mesobacillus foraminis]TCN18831.1 DNA-binding MarR family transcriptional regulator [Mesobacillus foraminis]